MARLVVLSLAHVPRLHTALLIAACFTAVACREEGAVQVKRLSLSGVQAVDEGRIRGALATRQSSRLPWGRKYYFDRGRFDADLKRIEAFYADRGYPDARVTGFDVKLNDEQDAVDITLTIAEGEPVLVSAVDFDGFRRSPAEPPRWSEATDAAQAWAAARPPARRDDARACRQRAARPRLSLRQGVDGGEQRGRTRRDRDFTADARAARPLRPDRDRRQSDGQRQRHRAQADLPAAATSTAAASCRTRSGGCIGWSCSNSSTSRRSIPRSRTPEVRTRVTVAEGQASARQLRRRLRHRGERPGRRRVPPRELPRRRAVGRHPRAVVVARSRRAARLHPAVLLQPPLLARPRRTAVVHLHAGLPIDRHRREGDADPPRHAADVVVGVDDRPSRTAARSPTKR